MAGEGGSWREDFDRNIPGRWVRAHQWQQALAAALRRAGKAREHVDKDPQGADWKVAIAAHLSGLRAASHLSAQWVV